MRMDLGIIPRVLYRFWRLENTKPIETRQQQWKLPPSLSVRGRRRGGQSSFVFSSIKARAFEQIKL